VANGGLVFTTIHKFMSVGGAAFSGRENIVAVADEAHQSQYGFGGRVNEKGEMAYGFASHFAMPCRMRRYRLDGHAYPVPPGIIRSEQKSIVT